MQRLIQAIDKATRAGVYTLEETGQILQAIDQVGAVVQAHNKRQIELKEQAKDHARAEAKANENQVEIEGPTKDATLEKA